VEDSHVHDIVRAPGGAHRGQLPATLDEAARFDSWRGRYNAAHGLPDVGRTDDRAFSLRFSFSPCGELGIGQFDGTISQSARTGHPVAAVSNDALCCFSIAAARV
jgi:hypothetical protein